MGDIIEKLIKENIMNQKDYDEAKVMQREMETVGAAIIGTSNLMEKLRSSNSKDDVVEVQFIEKNLRECSVTIFPKHFSLTGEFLLRYRESLMGQATELQKKFDEIGK